MFKIEQKLTTTYAEVGQINPLRWKTLLRDGDTFTDQSGWIKCKDFYNDTVAYFKAGTIFNMYGYHNKIEKNEEGVYFLLKYVKDVASFQANLSVINEQLLKDLGTIVSIVPYEGAGDEVVILIPNELWESTYRISMITFVIRLGNYGYKFTDWASLWDTNSPAYTQKEAFDDNAKKNARELGFKVPDGFEKYWYYAGADHNSEKAPKQTGGIIHNNGCCSWSRAMKEASL
jgi:hypothetical protein